MSDLLGILEAIAKNPGGADKLKDTKSPDDVVSLVKEHGMEIVVEEVHKVLASKGGSGGLIDHLIEGAVGGNSGKSGGEGLIEELLEGEGGAGGIIEKLLK